MGCEVRHRDYYMAIYPNLGKLQQRPQLAGPDRVTTSDTVDVGTERQKLFFFNFGPEIQVIWSLFSRHAQCMVFSAFIALFWMRISYLKLRWNHWELFWLSERLGKQFFFILFFFFTCTLVRSK